MRIALLTCLFVVFDFATLSGCTKKTAQTPPPNGGYTERVTDKGEIVGWAWDQTRPNDSISVEVYDGDVKIGEITADLFRQDLQTAGMGSGKHGFILPAPAKLRDGSPRTVHLKLASTKQELSGSPKTVQLKRDASSTNP
jgi:hypothetical protein